jgi:hypothetical protein
MVSLLDSASHWKEIVDLANKSGVLSNVPFQGPTGDKDARNADMGAQIGVLMGGETPPDLTKTFDPMKSAIQDLKDFGMDAFHGLASGFGDMVGAWASGANLGAHAMAKLVSSVLAGVAAQAATQAILFTAYGIAALTPWGAAIYGPAAPWFEAAALMASVAAVSGVLGRAIAPKESGAAASAGVPSSGRSSGGSSNSSPIDTGRTVGNFSTGPQVIELHIKSNDSHIVETFIKDWMGNGKVRTVVKADGMLAA